MFIHFSRRIQAIIKVAATFSSPNSVRHAIQKCTVSSYTRQISGVSKFKFDSFLKSEINYVIISKNKLKPKTIKSSLKIEQLFEFCYNSRM